MQAFIALCSGHAVVIAPLERMLTTTEAGNLLGITRQSLTRLIEAGDIRCSFTGRHRRIKLTDVLSYQHDRSARATRYSSG
ncbi:MAG: excisionase family DNA-binding protein [Candidatus Eremiobacteraeota bacterium]|nr:excisionase family DNA-binding protein [Candidatus Eremiobacteraeota bacterium]